MWVSVQHAHFTLDVWSTFDYKSGVMLFSKRTFGGRKPPQPGDGRVEVDVEDPAGKRGTVGRTKLELVTIAPWLSSQMSGCTEQREVECKADVENK